MRAAWICAVHLKTEALGCLLGVNHQLPDYLKTARDEWTKLVPASYALFGRREKEAR